MYSILEIHSFEISKLFYSESGNGDNIKLELIKI